MKCGALCGWQKSKKAAGGCFFFGGNCGVVVTQMNWMVACVDLNNVVDQQHCNRAVNVDRFGEIGGGDQCKQCYVPTVLCGIFRARIGGQKVVAVDLL